MARILIAASPGPRKILECILVNHQLTSAGTPAQATKYLRKEAFDLIICTVLFNDSRMFDFLRLVKDEEDWEQIPFICAQVRSNIPNMPAFSEATRFAAKQLGAATYLDILDYKNDPEDQFRRAIEGCLK